MTPTALIRSLRWGRTPVPALAAIATALLVPSPIVAEPRPGAGARAPVIAPDLQAVAAKKPVTAKAAARQSGALPPAKPAEPVLTRKEILAADAGQLERLGRHIIIGYELAGTVRALVEQRAIAGIFITDHNVRRRTAEAIKADIDRFQAIRKSQGLPPLIVSADQEGGAVSRLTPPLRRQPGLARVVAASKSAATREAAVRAYAETQAEELARLGVTMNFSPVVDLNLNPKRTTDGETKLRHRAIAADPEIVAEAAGWYCETLAARGLMCTLKHFPGLGRVAIDTHRSSGEIATSSSDLIRSDWVPYLRLMNRPGIATMVGHVRLPGIDKAQPASLSRPVITGLMRNVLGHDGIVITDDLSMGAVRRSKAGLGAASVAALNAGADYILISFSDRDLNAVMTALLAADRAGLIDEATREASRERISRFVLSAADYAASQR